MSKRNREFSDYENVQHNGDKFYMNYSEPNNYIDDYSDNSNSGSNIKNQELF